LCIVMVTVDKSTPESTVLFVTVNPVLRQIK